MTIEKGQNKCNSTESSTEIIQYTYDNLKNELIMNGVKYIVTKESNGQIKYLVPTPSLTGYDYVAYILEWEIKNTEKGQKAKYANYPF